MCEKADCPKCETVAGLLLAQCPVCLLRFAFARDLSSLSFLRLTAFCFDLFVFCFSLFVFFFVSSLLAMLACLHSDV